MLCGTRFKDRSLANLEKKWISDFITDKTIIRFTKHRY